LAGASITSPENSFQNKDLPQLPSCPAQGRPYYIFTSVKARTRFILGAVLVLGSAAYLMASSIRESGVYYFTPNELAAKIQSDPSLYETGVKVGGRVVKGTIVRDPGGRDVSFKITDSTRTVEYPVSYHGIIPDTFTDEVDVQVEGKLGRNNVFRATTLLAKCASKYEKMPEQATAARSPSE
jgi:cytochrome c-type biogenesis protein CcmE